MKPMKLLVPAICVAAGAVLWCGVLLNMIPKGSGAKPVKAWPAAGAKRTVRPRPEWPVNDPLAFRKVVVERTQPWLEARGRDAAGLLAVWDITADYLVLHETSQRFPDDLQVCRVMAVYDSRNRVESLKRAERLIAAEPENPYGYFVKARVLMEGRNTEEGLAALTQAVSVRGAYDDHVRERAALMREAALAAGMSPAAAARLLEYRAYANGALDRMAVFHQVELFRDVFRTEIKKAQKDGDEARAAELAELALGVAERWKGGAPDMTGRSSSANYFESQMLAMLPGDMEIGSEGLTVAERLSAVKARGDALREMNSYRKQISLYLDSAGEDEVLQYAENYLQRGEEFAVTSLPVYGQPVKREEPSAAGELLRAGSAVLLRAFLSR